MMHGHRNIKHEMFRLNVRVGLRKDCGGLVVRVGEVCHTFAKFKKACAQIEGTFREII